MLSRVADSIYWMSRYVERVENLARFIDVTLNLMLDLPGDEVGLWQPLVYTTGDHELFARKYGRANQEAVVRFLAFDTDYPNSIVSCLRAARENARSVRETISSEVWEHLNGFYNTVREALRGPAAFESPSEFFDGIKLWSHSFKGVFDSTMSRGEGWQIGRLGRLLERADKTSRILDVKSFMLPHGEGPIDSEEDDLQWSSVLHSVGGFEMYRQSHHALIPERVIAFLLLDQQFPRAIQYCIKHADRALHEVTGTPEGEYRHPAEERLGKLRREFAMLNVPAIVADGMHAFLDRLQTRLNEVGDALQSIISARAA